MIRTERGKDAESVAEPRVSDPKAVAVCHSRLRAGLLYTAEFHDFHADLSDVLCAAESVEHRD